LVKSKNGKLDLPYLKRYSEYTDANIFAENIEQGKLEHFQLEAGRFYGELTQIISDPVIISTHSMDLPMLQCGIGRKGYISFLIPGDMTQDVSWRKYRLTGKQIGILKSEGLHFAITPRNFFATPVSLRNEYFAELIQKHGYDDKMYDLVHQAEAIDLDQEDAFRIQQMVISLCRATKLDHYLMSVELPKLILKSISNIAEALPEQVVNSRNSMISNILAYIQDNLEHKITTLDIASALDLSERNLRYLFNDLIGVSPMKYIKLIKLNKVRKEIKDARDNGMIYLIANKWGFINSGQFAMDYKKLFGELPSDTLNGSAAANS